MTRVIRDLVDRTVVNAIMFLGLWRYCDGLVCVASARDDDPVDHAIKQIGADVSCTVVSIGVIVRRRHMVHQHLGNHDRIR